MLYCPYCWQKSAHIPDFSEKEFVKRMFDSYDKKKIKEQIKTNKEQ